MLTVKKLILFLACSLVCPHSHSASLSTKKKILIPQEAIKPLLKTYSEQERVAIENDLKSIRTLIFSDSSPSPGKKVYLATAGTPGSRKSTTLESYREKNPVAKTFVYLDPDARGLFLMSHTYTAKSLNYFELSKSASFTQAKRSAYLKWRNASNFITNRLLNEAFQLGRSIAHGATLTGSAVPVLLEKLKKEGYEIHLILCFAPKEVTQEALKIRNKVQGNVQSLTEDEDAKLEAFFRKIPTYFNWADQIQIHFSESVQDSLDPIANFDLKQGKKTLHNELKYNRFLNFYKNKQNELALEPWEQITAKITL